MLGMGFEAKISLCFLVESHLHVGRLKSEPSCTEETVQAWETRSFHYRTCSHCTVSDLHSHRYQFKTTLEFNDRGVAGVSKK